MTDLDSQDKRLYRKAVAQIIDAIDGTTPERRFSSQHWLLFGKGKIEGCQCGFRADEMDAGYGDSVVDHFADVIRQPILDLIAHAKQVSPSDRMNIAVGDLEHALGLRPEPARSKNDDSMEAAP